MAEIVVVVGTRPEIIKMAPVMKALDDMGLEYRFIHTGQHYDYNMSRLFIEQLGLREPDKSFELTSSNPAGQIGEMMIKLEETLADVKKGVMIIQGDTNTMLAAGLTAVKLGLRLGHVEAGLRSFDWRMPEEHNRRMIDHVSDYLFAPTRLSARNLQEEHVWGTILVTGNTVIDAIDLYKDRVVEVEDSVVEMAGFTEYALVTFHRRENVDDPKTLRDLVRVVLESPIPVVFPVHPRTRARLAEQGLLDRLVEARHVRILEPLGYFEFLALMRNAKVILTDSGGVQEEATHPMIRRPVLILRTSTERPEAIRAGFARLVGTTPLVVLSALEQLLEDPPRLPEKSPFGDGKAGVRIASFIADNL